MKFYVISLALVASVALARPIPEETLQLDPRTLIGDEYSIRHQVDNSIGKKTISIDHNGDSSVHKGLLADLIDSHETNGDRFLRRSLLGDLLGSDSTTIENINDNSKHKKTINEHHNKDISIRKSHYHHHRHHRRDELEEEAEASESFDRRSDDLPLERRGLLDGLLGSSHTSISNVNDNSKTSKKYNSHRNTYKDIRHGDYRDDCRFRKRDDNAEEQGEDLDEEDQADDEGDYEDEDTHGEAEEEDDNKVEAEADKGVKKERRGLLLGDTSTGISNVNDNSKTTKTYNTHDNVREMIDSRKHHYKGYGSKCRRPRRHHRHYEKRGLLLGGSRMDIENINDNSEGKTSYTLHGNTVKGNQHEEDIFDFFDKRNVPAGDETIAANSEVMDAKKDMSTKVEAKHSNNDKRSVSRTHIEFESVSAEGTKTEGITAEDGQQAEEKVEDQKRSLVTIQIINTNTNQDGSGANLIYTVTPDRPYYNSNKGPSQPSAYHRHPSRATAEYLNKIQQQDKRQPTRNTKGNGKKIHRHERHPHSKITKKHRPQHSKASTK
ncbi:hypothetical protein BGW41_006859 [Actinomortierella wolfii]|nr:hypothetical protein BGW41_006859 [Actinomortierella wolfii]